MNSAPTHVTIEQVRTGIVLIKPWPEVAEKCSGSKSGRKMVDRVNSGGIWNGTDYIVKPLTGELS